MAGFKYYDWTKSVASSAVPEDEEKTMTYAEFKAKRNSASQNSAQGSSPTMTYTEFKARQARNSAGWFDSQVKDYLKACKDYSDNATKVSSTINSGNAAAVGLAQIDAAKGIREKHKTLDDYLQKYKDVIDPQAYAQISLALTQSMTGVNEIAKHFGDVAAGIKNMTAEDYANAAKQTQWQIDRYAPLLEEYKELTKWEQDEKGNARIDYIRGIHGDVSEFEKELEDLRFQQYSYENLAKYADLSKNADFAEKSVYQGDGSVLQDRVNNPEKSKLMDNAHTIAQYVPLEPTTHTYALIQQLWNYENTHLMTEDEVKNFNYLYNTQGKTAAKEYMDYLQYALNKRSQENTSAKVAELTSAIPGLSQTLASLVSTPLTLAGGSGILDAGAQKLIKGVTGDDTPVDYNRDAMFASNISNTIRGTVAKDISESIGGGWGEAASTAYQLGMSMQDSAAIAAMATINPVLGTVGTALLSGSAATTTMKQAAENGATDGQALTVGLLAGAWEFIFEKYELDTIMKGGKNIWLSLLKSSLSEATGEAATEIANLATDVYVLAENSNWERNVQAYVQQYKQEHPGAADEEAQVWAEEQAFKSAGMQVINAFVGGLITGGIMGGGMHGIQSSIANQKAGNNVLDNPGGVPALKQAALDTGAELGGRQQKQLERLAGKVSDEVASGTGFKGIAANVRNAVNAQRLGKLYNKTVQGNSRLNVADMKARLQEEGYSEKEAASIAEAVDDAMWGRDLRDMLGREAADRQSDLLESVMQDPRYQRAIESALLDKDSQTMNRFMRPEQALMKHDTQKESSVPATEMAAPAVSAPREGTGTPEVVQAPANTQVAAEPMDYGEVYSAVESARENGALDNARYEQLMDSLQNAVVDLEAGRIDEATYNGILQSAAEQANMGSRVVSQGEYAARNQDLQVRVDDETWQQGQRLAKALHRDIVFYNGRKGENGRHVNGTIYVNVNSDMPLMQVVCHELTHSLEGTKAYKQLLNHVMRQYRKNGYDIARVRAAKVALYKRYDVNLKTQAEVDQEIVAEYMEKHLLADEQSILDLVREEPNVAKRILSWIKGKWKLLTSAGDAKTIAQMEWAQRIYSKALSQSLKALPNEGQIAAGKSPTQVKTDSIRQGRQQVSEAYRKGELTDEQHDAAMDEYDRAEEDELGTLVGEYSFSEAQENTADSGGEISFRDELSAVKYNRLLMKKKIKVSRQEWAMIKTQRKTKYSSIPEENIPVVDFFSIGDYRNIDTAYIYCVRNSGADDFSVVMRKMVIPDAKKVSSEVINNEDRINNAGTDSSVAREKGKRGSDRSDSEYIRNGRQLSEDDEGVVRYAQAQRDMPPGNGDADSRAAVSSSEEFTDSQFSISSDVGSMQVELQRLKSQREAILDADQAYRQAEEALRYANTFREKVEARKAINAAASNIDTAELDQRIADLQEGIRYAMDSDRRQHREDQEKYSGTKTKGYSQLPDTRLKDIDQEYIEAVRNGDQALIELLVARAAEAAMPNSVVRDDSGKLLKVYHYTNGRFTVFDRSMARTGTEMDGFFFAPDAISTQEYGDRAVVAYLNITKLAYDPMLDRKFNDSGTLLREKLAYQGYDGVARTEDGRIYEYMAFDPKQIKSAEPIVYDDAGNVIPLSERFNFTNDDIRYSFSNDVVEEDQRVGQGWYDTDEKQLQAKKKGYPVLHGEQVVPFNTWVQTKDRGNYGLVTGLAPGNKLLVNFHNKHEDASAEVAIPYGNLVPVPGAYQMTKEEFDSLMASEPLDVNSMELTEADQEALEEMYRRSGGEKSDMPTVDIEKMPRKAKDYLRRAENRLLRDLANRLGVSKFVDRTYLKEIVEEIANAYLTEGTVSNELISQLFDKAYDQGVIVDKSFYEQYKHIKDVLRTTAVTLSEQDRADIADFSDFRKRQFNRLRIVDKGGTPVNQLYEELHDMASELFPESITHPADQLVQMSEVSRSIAVSERLLSEYYGKDAEMYRSWARNEFDSLVSQTMGDLFAIRRFAAEKASKAAKEKAPTTPQEAMEVYKKLKNSRRVYERATARNLLTDHDEMMVGRLLRHEMELSHLDPERDNVKGITEVFEAKREYEEYCRLIRDYKKQLNKNRQSQADRYLETAQRWKDKKMGIAYSRETMRRNIYDIVPDKNLAREINEAFFEPVHDSEADATRMKNRYRKRVESLGLSREVAKGNLVSEAHVVQLLGEAEDNIRMLENAKGRMQQRDGKTLAEWRGVVLELWKSNPNLDEARIRNGVAEFRKIYDELFEQMNLVRVENGYEPISYRSGYFPHFQPDQADGILAQFGRALGIETQVVQLPTTISGLTHTFKPGIQWFGNAMERLGFNTAYDAVEGFDKYIEGAASVIHQTANIQNLRALATQIRYRTSQEGIQEQVDAVREDDRLSEDEKQIKIKDILEHGKYELANFVAELDEYTNLLANKKSKYDRQIEAAVSRKVYAFLKWWEGRVAANMIAGNLSSAFTNFIPLTQAGAQLDKVAMLRGMWDTLKTIKTDDGLVDISSFLTNRKGSDPLVKAWQKDTPGFVSSIIEEKSPKVAGTKAYQVFKKGASAISKPTKVALGVISEKASLPMELIDGFTSGSVVRAAYYHNLKRGMSEAEAMHQADIFAAGVIADRSKGSTPTLFQSTNPLYKAFTQFQLEVNNQFSEVFKDLPRNHREKGVLKFAAVLFQYFLGAFLFNELYEKLLGRRPALDPIGLALDARKDFKDPDVGFGEGMKNLAMNAVGELPFSSGLTLLGIETDGGRIPASSAVPDLTALWDAATKDEWSGKKRWKEAQDELNKLSYIVTPFGGNQVSKLWKGIKALAEGGSYSVDNQGNEILQYPVDMDDPWSALGAVFRATHFGKSSLPEAQEWVEGGFDSLTARETAVYRDMRDAGISVDEAHGFIQKLGTARKTDKLSVDAVKRQIIRDADVSNEAKAIAYYGLLAKHDEEQKSMTEREIMDGLAEMGADAWEVTKVLMASKDANKLEGIDEGIAKRNAIAESALTHEEKVFMYRELVSEGRSEDIDIFRDAGLEFDQFVKIHNQYVRINDMDASASIKATLLARWVDGQDYTPAQKQLVKDEFAYYSMVPATAVKYDKFVAAGMDYDQAVELIEDLTALEPAEDEIQVKDIQRWRTCVDFSSSTAMQLAALRGSMTDSQYAKVDAAYQNSVSPEMYVTFRETLPKYDADGNGSLNGKEVEKAVRSMSGLSNSQKAVLWQLAVNSKSAKNNPFSTSVGERILKALEKE